MKHKILFSLFLVLCLLVLFWLSKSTLETYFRVSNRDDIANLTEGVPPKPIVDNAKVETTILKLNKTGPYHKALVRIDKIVSYTRDQRAKYSPLFEEQELEMDFQWGADPRIIDLPPVDDSLGDIILPGVKEADKILADVDNKYGWRIYNYEVLK